MNVPLPASLFVCSLSSPSCLEFFKILKHLSSCQLIGFADQFSGTPALSRNPPTADAIVSLLFSSDFSIKNHLCIVQWREERMNLFLLKLEWSQSSKSIITLTGTEFCKDWLRALRVVFFFIHSFILKYFPIIVYVFWLCYENILISLAD